MPLNQLIDKLVYTLSFVEEGSEIARKLKPCITMLESVDPDTPSSYKAELRAIVAEVVRQCSLLDQHFILLEVPKPLKSQI